MMAASDVLGIQVLPQTCRKCRAGRAVFERPLERAALELITGEQVFDALQVFGGQREEAIDGGGFLPDLIGDDFAPRPLATELCLPLGSFEFLQFSAGQFDATAE